MLIGYARVSTVDQNLDLQEDALRKAGCERLFTDIASGVQAAREGLREALDFLRAEDTLVVWKLDRLGRSLAHLLEVINTLHARQIGFRSLQESVDTMTSSGKLFFHIFGALAEFERNLIRERTMAGLAAARARGRHGGRPRAMSSKQVAMATALRHDPRTTIADICQTLGVSRATRVTSAMNTPSCWIMVLTIVAERRNSPSSGRPSTSSCTVCVRFPCATAAMARVTSVVGRSRSSMSVLTETSISPHAPFDRSNCVRSRVFPSLPTTCPTRLSS